VGGRGADDAGTEAHTSELVPVLGIPIASVPRVWQHILPNTHAHTHTCIHHFNRSGNAPRTELHDVAGFCQVGMSWIGQGCDTGWDSACQLARSFWTSMAKGRGGGWGHSHGGWSHLLDDYYERTRWCTFTDPPSTRAHCSSNGKRMHTRGL
jgi:hypothetical protein